MKTKQIISIYLSGFLAGVVLILYPAAGNIFMDPEFHGITNEQFGNIFIPQIILAIIASFSAPKIAEKVSMKKVLLYGLILLTLSLVFLATTQLFLSGRNDFYLILAGTTCLGAGFGFTITALNPFAYQLFPGKETSAVTGLHILLGLGTASASLILNAFYEANLWYGAPIFVGVISLLLLFFTLTIPLKLSQKNSETDATSKKTPIKIWLFGVIVFFYAASEATFGNWGSVFLEKQGGLSKTDAALGLSLFWGFVAVGRFIFTLIALKFETKWLYMIAPFILAIVFYILPKANTPTLLLALMIIAGLTMSFLFPKTISVATDQFPVHGAFISGLTVGALQLGNGVSSNVIGSLAKSYSLNSLFQFSTIYALIFGLIIVYLTFFNKNKSNQHV